VIHQQVHSLSTYLSFINLKIIKKNNNIKMIVCLSFI